MDAHLLIALFHICLVVPFFLYVAFQRTATPDWAYHTLFGLGIVVTAYHGFKAIGRLVAKSPHAWVNILHATLFGPLMIYIGFTGKKTPRPAYEMLLMAAFAALGYHMSSLVIMSQTYVKGHKDED
jgi:hypothetical protein